VEGLLVDRPYFVVPPVAMIAYLAYQFQTYVIGQKQDDATATNSQARHGFERATAFSSAEEIERLNELKQRGLITNEEFAVLCSKLFK
jgi:hypothetical protein